MKKYIKLTLQPRKVFVNVKTLKCVECDIYTTSDHKNDWIQLNKRELQQYMKKSKA